MGTQISANAASPSVTGYTMNGHLQLGAQDSSKGVHRNAAIAVSGAAVTLYSAGIAGYGSPAVALARTTTDAGGTFSFVQGPSYSSTGSTTNQYKCPVYTFTSADTTSSITSDSLLYIVVNGGNTGAGVNTSAVLMTVVGGCAAYQANPLNLVVDAVTTAASVFSLAPYISPVYTTNPGSLLGTSTAYQAQYSTAANPTGAIAANTAVVPMGYTGLANAFYSVSKLVDLQSGGARSAYSISANGVSITATPETAKLNHIASVLSTCIDSTGGTPCTTLFGYTVPPPVATRTSLGAVTFPAAADTLQAAYYMATNPTDFATVSTLAAPNAVYTNTGTPIAGTNIANIFALATATADYQPTLTAQPSDWTLSIAYSSATVCGTDTQKALYIGTSPYAAAVDLSGNVSFISANATGTLPNTGSTLSGITNTGAPAYCVLGGYTSGRTVVVDIAGNTWGSTSSTSATNAYVPEYTAGGTVVKWPATNGTTTYGPYSLAADGKGNLFYAGQVTSTPYSLQEFAGAAFATTPANSTTAGTAGAASYNYYYLAADSAGNILAPHGTSSLFSDFAIQPTGNTYAVTALSASTAISTQYGIAVDAAGAMYGGNTCCTSTYSNFVYKVPITYATAGGLTTPTAGTPLKIAAKNYGGVDGVRSVALDGAGNIWVGNYYTASGSASSSTANGTGMWAVSEVDNSLNTISSDPSSGFTCAATSQYTCADYAGFIKSNLGSSRGLIVDQSGNVWVPSDLSLNIASSGGTVPPGNIVEIIGAAVPTVQPLSIAARDGKLATKP